MVWCSDCHGDVSGATGPHGAGMTVNYATGYDNSYSTGVLYNNAGSMSNTTALCNKCHVSNIGYNNVHTTGNHQGNGATSGRCTACHIKVPHAWKRPRLIGYTTDPAPYTTTGLTGINQTPTRTLTGWTQANCGGCGTHTVSGTVWP
ncbi:MAG: hypothetical protein FDZ75_00520 [Actinobacteria bacterium]|nr:MAG: hypothetical protein FDZ75_00520 [Actinomycetota bacterium]